MKSRKLRKMSREGWLGGVCAGMGYWLGCPVWVIRLLWFLTAWFYGFGILVYVLLWVFLPTWEHTPDDYQEVTGD
jgi:phage shock protein PspC (stress-responsive transcriptional regulator)